MEFIEGATKELLNIGGLFSFTYFLFSVSADEVTNGFKSELNEKIMKINSITITVSILFIFYFIKGSSDSSRMDIRILCAVVLNVSSAIFLLYIKRRLVKLLRSKKNYNIESKKKISTVIIMSLIFVCVSVYLTSQSVPLSNILNNSFGLIEGILLIFEYATLILTLGYLHTIILLMRIKMFLIKTDEFKGGYALAYVVSETENEIMVKCQNSYPIIIPKDKINGYIEIPSSTAMKDKDESYIIKEVFDNYRGYWIE